MSAYVCADAQFKALAIFAVRKISGAMNVDPAYVNGAQDLKNEKPLVIANRYAALLLAENVRSVRYRYSDDIGDYEPVIVTDADISNAAQLDPVVILKLCANLDYQSCETPDWKTTQAHGLLEQIRDEAIRQLPGYEDAPWGLLDLPMTCK